MDIIPFPRWRPEQPWNATDSAAMETNLDIIWICMATMQIKNVHEELRFP